MDLTDRKSLRQKEKEKIEYFVIIIKYHFIFLFAH